MDRAEGYEGVGELIRRLEQVDAAHGLTLHIYAPSPGSTRYSNWRAYRQPLSGELDEGHGATLAEALEDLAKSLGA